MLRLVIASVLLSASAWAQPASRLEFEVASVKLSPPLQPGRGFTPGCVGGPGSKDPVLLTCENVSLTNLILMAYQVEFYQLSEPDGLITTRFDVRATVPEGTTKEAYREMLQNLLADRFKLAVHRETREIKRYELMVAKGGPKFKEAAPPAPNDAKNAPPPGSFDPPSRDKEGYPVLGRGMTMAIMYDKARLHYPDATMDAFARMLAGQLGGPVIDSTGLAGKYELDMYWVASRALPAAAPAAAGTPEPESDPGPTIEQALQSQLGLRLDQKKGPIDFVVVDHIEKTPTEN